RVPGLPGTARPVGPVGRGPGRVLARPGAGGARLRRRGQRIARRGVPAGLSRIPVFVRLSGLPGSRGPRQTWGAPRAGSDRGDAVRGAAVASGAVHRCADRAPPPSEVLQREVAPTAALPVLTCGRTGSELGRSAGSPQDA